jgi:hypothetical protein
VFTEPMLCALAFVLLAGVSAVETPFQVVVHRSNPVVTVTRAELSAMYMKRRRSWPDGEAVVPVDQPARSSLREDFARTVHGKSVAYVTRYWQRVIFSGRGIPPAEVRSSAAALAIVRTQRGAVAYIDAHAPTGEGVKVIAVTP